ncbi:hypothetical protein HaLaN_31203 [Haematococcus lacustris]|uniref:Uncharacterized protein n=1 Tax=Haematococcus lacustris TaxID=44745 RepID=A0A6A0AI94_HAELA|nr:hypothetical protein HaLaN_31203 [Haematococcus lacustris]
MACMRAESRPGTPQSRQGTSQQHTHSGKVWPGSLETCAAGNGGEALHQAAPGQAMPVRRATEQSSNPYSITSYSLPADYHDSHRSLVAAAAGCGVACAGCDNSGREQLVAALPRLQGCARLGRAAGGPVRRRGRSGAAGSLPQAAWPASDVIQQRWREATHTAEQGVQSKRCVQATLASSVDESDYKK